MASFFDFLMRKYAPYVIPIGFILFAISEFISSDLAKLIASFWGIFNALLIALGWLFQAKLYSLAKENINILIFTAAAFFKNRLPYAPELCLWENGVFPGGIETIDIDAHLYLEGSKRMPYLHEITKTQFNFNPQRFSWMEAKKKSADELISKLSPGDIILLHTRGSIIGILIRFFTRHYWEHVATYIGEGFVMDVAPGGTRRVLLKPWIENSKTSLAFIRFPDHPWEERKAFTMKTEGTGYNYRGMAKIAWQIMCGQQGAFGLTFKRLAVAIIIISSIVFFSNSLEWPPRLVIALQVIYGLYATSTIYHPIAYSGNLDELNNILSGPNE